MEEVRGTTPVEKLEDDSTGSSILPVTATSTVQSQNLDLEEFIRQSAINSTAGIEQWLSAISLGSTSEDEESYEYNNELHNINSNGIDRVGKQEEIDIFLEDFVIGDCPICTEPLIHKPVMILECNHEFCTLCIYEWMRVKFSCPVCRASIGNNNDIGNMLEEANEIFSQYSTDSEDDDYEDVGDFDHTYDDWGDCLSCGYPGYNDIRWESVREAMNSELGVFMQEEASLQDSEVTTTSEEAESSPEAGA